MKTLMITLIALIAAPGAQAYQKRPEKFSVPNPKALAAHVETVKDLKMPKLELLMKKDLAHIRVTNRKKFADLKSNELENAALYQSFINEIDDAFNGKAIPQSKDKKFNYFEKYVYGKAPIDIARKIAKKELLDLISRNWVKLKETIFNEYDVESWAQARGITTEKMNESLIYVPRKNAASYLFKFGDSFAEIDKATLKTGRVALDIDSRLDSNSLAADADHIVADDQGSRKIVTNRTETKSPARTEKPLQEKPAAIDNTPGPADVINLENF